MSRSHDPFNTALKSLRQRLQEGRYSGGEPIVIIEEARRLRLSATPVREALACLCGEGLIERAATGGYLAPRLEPSGVRDRYTLRLLFVRAAIETLAALPNGRSALRSDVGQEGGFPGRLARLVRASGNHALAAAHARTDGQLARLRAAEREVFTDSTEEEAALSAHLDAGELTEFRDGVVAYHDRRIATAPLLVVAAEKAVPLGQSETGA